jgi:hypothetical protein
MPEESAAEWILARARPMCTGYARLYMAWVNVPAQDLAGRKQALTALRAHAVVCGCVGGEVKRDWIFVEDEDGPKDTRD